MPDLKPQSNAEKIAIGIFGCLWAVFCFGIAGGAVFFVLGSNNSVMKGAAPQPYEQAAAATSPLETPTPTFTPSPVYTLAPTYTPTWTPPPPTATRVVSKAFVNKDKIEHIMTEVSYLRGLTPLSEVPARFLTREELEQLLREEAEYSSSASSINSVRELYIAMSLVEEDVDFGEAAVESAAESVAGFYSPEEKVLYVVMEGDNIFAEEEVVYAHEYCHALQDQYFDTKRFIDEEVGGDVSEDQALARRALVEGDATLLMTEYNYREIPQSARDYIAYQRDFAQNVRLASNIDEQKESELKKISPSLTLMTLFPYNYGVMFVFGLFVEGGFNWNSVNDAFADPPQSTEQVIHIEKYLLGEQPVQVTLPELAASLGGTWYELDRDVFGELGLLAWLLGEMNQDTSIEEIQAMSHAAAGWGGDAYTLLVDGQGHRLLAVKAVWDTENDAQEFFDAFGGYQASVRSGPQDAPRELIEQDAGTRLWTGHEGLILLKRRGTETLVIIAPDRPTLDVSLAAFGF